MDWKLLQEHKCPQCSTPFQQGLLDLYIYCQCGFTISQSKYEEIVSRMIKKSHPEKKVYTDNAEELNNL